MADYWISFRVKSDNTYDQRYGDMIDAINEHATGAWETDTSFLAIRSESSIDAIGQSVKAVLNKTTDHFVIRQIDFISTCYINEPGKGFLAFFPRAIKL